MSNDDYALWVKLANDPSQPEEARQQYRSRMEAYLHQKMREAFQLATRQTPSAQGARTLGFAPQTV